MLNEAQVALNINLDHFKCGRHIAFKIKKKKRKVYHPVVINAFQLLVTFRDKLNKDLKKKMFTRKSNNTFRESRVGRAFKLWDSLSHRSVTLCLQIIEILCTPALIDGYLLVLFCGTLFNPMCICIDIDRCLLILSWSVPASYQQ